LSVRICYDKTKFRLTGWRKVEGIFEKVIGNEFKIPGDLFFIITNDRSLRKINVQFLNHNYNTDVITFNYNVGSMMNGEIYISIETVKRNAKKYRVSIREELLRVMIHGVLHLVGYDDKTEEQRQIMRNKENYWLDITEKS
jgi:probable rRNA maturation factor